MKSEVMHSLVPFRWVFSLEQVTRKVLCFIVAHAHLEALSSFTLLLSSHMRREIGRSRGDSYNHELEDTVCYCGHRRPLSPRDLLLESLYLPHILFPRTEVGI